MSYNKMTMGAAKSHILTTLQPSHPDYPTDKCFKLGNDPITDIIPPSESIRILGIQFTMGNNQTKVKEFARSKIENMLDFMQYKFIPGNLSPQIINTVLHPMLTYIYQTVSLTKTEIDEIEVMLRKITKRKMCLPNRTPTDSLYDKELYAKLKSFQTQFESQLLDNFANDISSTGYIGDITHAIAKYYQTKYNTPLPLFEAPIYINPNSNAFKCHFMYLVNLLYTSNRRIRRNIINHDTPYHVLNVEEYHKHHKNLRRLGIVTTQDIIHQQTARQNSTGIPNSKPYREFLNNTRPENAVGAPGQVPLCYPILINAHSSEPATSADNFNSTTSKPLKISAIPRTTFFSDKQDLIQKINSYHSIDIWTDGSLQSQHMASGAVLIGKTHDNYPMRDPIIIPVKPTQHESSSTKPELFAIYYALEYIAPFAKQKQVSVYSDSQSSVKALNNSKYYSLSQRKRRKQPNYDIIEATYHLLSKFDSNPTISWVKGHSMLEFNELADKIAKEAIHLERITDILPFKTGKALARDYHIYQYSASDKSYYRSGKDPRKLISDPFNESTTVKTDEMILHNYKHLIRNNYIIAGQNTFSYSANDQLDIKMTKAAIHTCLHRTNGPQDNNNHRLVAFRHNILMKQLQTLDLYSQYDHCNLSTATCLRCKTAIETPEHIFSCYKNSFSKVLQSIEKELDESLRDPNLNMAEDLKSKTLINLLQLDSPTILNSSISRGYITSKFIRKFKSIRLAQRTLPIQLILHIAGAITKAIFDVVWTPRTRQLNEENSIIPNKLPAKKYISFKERRKQKQTKQTQRRLKKAEERLSRHDEVVQHHIDTINQIIADNMEVIEHTNETRFNVKRTVKQIHRQRLPPSNKRKLELINEINMLQLALNPISKSSLHRQTKQNEPDTYAPTPGTPRYLNICNKPAKRLKIILGSKITTIDITETNTQEHSNRTDRQDTTPSPLPTHSPPSPEI